MKLLETMAAGEPIALWKGDVRRNAGSLPDGRPGAMVSGMISTMGLASDWTGFKSLQYTVYNPGVRVGVGGLFILDEEACGSAERQYGDFVDRANTMIYPDGITHVVVDIDPIQTTQGSRMLNLRVVRELGLGIPTSQEQPYVLANIRLSKEAGKPDAASGIRPGDTVMHLRHMDVECYTFEPERCPESEDAAKLRRKVESETARLEEIIGVARLAGKQTLYEEIGLAVSDIAVKARPLLPWHFSGPRRKENLTEALEIVRPLREHLEKYVKGIIHEDDEDDSNWPIPWVADVPDLRSLKIDGRAFVNELGEPQLVCAMNYHHTGRLMRFFAPDNHRFELYAVGGGSRYDIDWSPVYHVFHASQKARRVGWRGWCGHLIKDQWAMGGRKENVVICLEHEPILKAIREYNRQHAHEWKALPQLMYTILAYELMYICYCDESIRRFREWLKKKHGTLQDLNRAWGTEHRSFKAVEPPSAASRGPAADCNRAAWYDWADWNTRRFTDHLKWCKRTIRELDKRIPTCAGGTSSMFSPGNSTTGIDEELIINELDDVILHEGGDVMGIDLFHSLSDKPKPLVDPEHGGDSSRWLLNYLHGKSTIAKFWWPKQPSRCLPRNTMGSPQHGMVPLGEVAEELRIALDVRRLNREIVAFWDLPKEVAILYSKTNILQVPPGLITARTTPYLQTLRLAYDTARFLDAAPTFLSDRLVAEGRAGGMKAVILPGTRHLKADVFRALDRYVKAGGVVVALPELPAADEYCRPAKYLAGWGVTIRRSHVPQMAGLGELEQGYDQSLDRSVEFGPGKEVDVDELDAEFFGGGPTPVRTSGIFQELDVKGARVLASSSSDGPVILMKKVGKGRVYLLAGTPEQAVLARFLDVLYEQIGVMRHLRLSGPDGRRVLGLEARLVRRRHDDLVYVVNTTAEEARFRIETDRPWHRVRELRSLRYWTEPAGVIPASQTFLFSLLEDPRTRVQSGRD